MSDYLNIQEDVNQSTGGDHDGSIQIAPELMGEQGLPPSDQPSQQQQQHSNATSTRRTPQPDPPTAQDGPSEGYPGFASSNARGGDSDPNNQWDAAVYGTGLTDKGLPPWANADYTYPSDPSSALPTVETTLAAAAQEGKDVSGEMTDQEGPKSKKRPRPSKPRQSKIDKEPLVDIADMIFENNEQDIRTGPVFVHSPAGTAQACIRCHRIKRKCDQARPRCQGCSKADVACVYELSPATSLWLNQLKGDNTILSTQIASAHDRIAQLEALVSTLERNGNQSNYPSMDESYERQFEEITASTSGVTDFSALARTILAGRSEALPSGPNTTPYPSYEVALTSVRDFFTIYGNTYPIFDQDQLVTDTETLYSRLNDPEYLSSTEDDESKKGKEFVLFLIVSLGIIEKEKRGEVEKGFVKAYREKALTGLSSAIGKGDMSSVRALYLLVIHSLVVPSDLSPFQVLGHAQQAAVSLNLFQPGEGAKTTSTEAILRSRMLFSALNLERLVSFTLNRPLLVDAHDRVEVLDDISNFIGNWRCLMGRTVSILSKKQFASHDLVVAERNALISAVQVASFHPSIIDDAATSAVRLVHHQVLTRLYLPSPRFPTVSSEDLSKLYDAASIVVDILHERVIAKSTPFNVVTIYDTLHALIAVMYVLKSISLRANGRIGGWDELVTARIHQVHAVYDVISPVIANNNKAKQPYETLFYSLEPHYSLDMNSRNWDDRNRIIIPKVELPSSFRAMNEVDDPDVKIVEDAIRSQWNALDGKVDVEALEVLNAGLRVVDGQTGWWNGL